MLLVIPLGLVGAIFAVTLRGLQNDVYLQVGLITTMGLSAKNAILMVEFAERAEREGKRVIDAAIEAARIRLAADPDDQLRLHLRRPSAGACDRRRREQPDRDRHRGVGGMLTATILADLLHPVLLRARPARRPRRHQGSPRAAAPPAGGAGMKRAAALLALLATACATMEPQLGRPDPAIPPSWPAGDPYLVQAEAACPP